MVSEEASTVQEDVTSTEASTKPENQEKWKYFMRQDIYDVTWYNIPRYLTYLPRFIIMWTVVLASGGFALYFQKTSKDPNNLSETAWKQF